MNLSIAERVAQLEEQNKSCAEERRELGDKVSEHDRTYQQIRGSIRTLVILWAVLTSAVGLAAAKYVAREAGAQVAPFAGAR